MAISKQEKRLAHLPNPMHLEACKKGGRIHKSKKTYTRKGKKRFDYRKEDFGSHFFMKKRLLNPLDWSLIVLN